MLFGKHTGAITLFILLSACTQAAIANEITVYKKAACGCCDKWVDHLNDAGFTVTATSHKDMDSIKEQHGVPSHLTSCHTAVVGGYVIEGHVPANDILRLLKENPEVTGLAAPGMPRRSPGMHRHGLKPKKYDVLTFDKEGKTTVFNHY